MPKKKLKRCLIAKPRMKPLKRRRAHFSQEESDLITNVIVKNMVKRDYLQLCKTELKAYGLEVSN